MFSEFGAKISKISDIWKLYINYVLAITFCDTNINYLEIYNDPNSPSPFSLKCIVISSKNAYLRKKNNQITWNNQE